MQCSGGEVDSPVGTPGMTFASCGNGLSRSYCMLLHGGPPVSHVQATRGSRQVRFTKYMSIQHFITTLDVNAAPLLHVSTFEICPPKSPVKMHVSFFVQGDANEVERTVIFSTTPGLSPSMRPLGFRRAQS
jgi:hypothetical protein